MGVYEDLMARANAWKQNQTAQSTKTQKGGSNNSVYNDLMARANAVTGKQSQPTEQQAAEKSAALNQQIATQKRAMDDYSGWATDDLSRANMGVDEQERRIAELTRQKKAAEQEQRKAVQTNAERDKLRSTIKNTQEYSGWATDDLSRANMGIDTAERNRKTSLEQLKAIDAMLGNIERPYDDRQRAGYTVGGALKNTGGSIVEGVTTALDLMAKYNSQNPYLTTEEMGIAKALGMTPEEYAEEKMKGGTEEARRETFAPFYNTADRLMQESASDIQAAKADLGALGQAGVDLSVNLVQMGADAAGRAVGLGMLPFFTRAAGGSAYEARQEGASLEQRAAYGALKGAIEVGTEKLFDGVAGIFGKGAADDVVEATARKLAKTDKGRTVLRAFAGAAGEGTEEVISDLLDPLAKLIYNDQAVKDAWENRKDLASDMLYDYLIGFAMGGLGAGGSIITGQDAAKNKAARKADIESEEMAIDQRNALEDIRAQTFDNAAAMKLGYLFGYDTLDEANAAQAAQNNTAPDNGTDSVIQISNGPSALNTDTRGAVNLLARNIGQIENDVPVATLSGREMKSSGKKVSEQISDFFKRIGGQVERPGFGSVELGKYSLGSILNHRPLNRAKLVSLTAVPEVISEGKVISDVDNWKGRGYRSIVFAAPVTIAGEKVYVAAIVNQFPGSNKFYLNECVDTQGNYIRINEVSPNNTKTGFTAADGITGGSEETSPFVTTPNGMVGEAVASPTNNISPAPQNVNRMDAKTQRVYDFAGVMLGIDDSSQTQQNAAGAQEVAEGVNTIGAEGQNAGEGASGLNVEARGAEREYGFAKNVRTDAAMDEAIRADLEENKQLYSQLSNADVLAKATQIMQRGLDYATATVQSDLAKAKGGRKLNPATVPLARMVANQLTKNGNIETAKQILADVNVELLAGGRLGQVAKLLRNADPASVEITIEKALNEINEQFQKKHKHTKWEAKLTEAERERISNTDFTDPKAFEQVYQDVMTRVGKEMPASFGEKLQEYRRVSMLLRPRTMIKNVLSNVPMAGMRKIADTMSGALQDLMIATGNMEEGTQMRTAKVSKASKSIARAVYFEYADELAGKGDKFDKNSIINENRTYFKAHKLDKLIKKGLKDLGVKADVETSVMESLRQTTYNLLEKGDSPFVKSAFIDNLAQYCEAQGIKTMQEVTQEAIDFATENAMEATFKAENVLAKAINQVKRKGGAFGALADVLVPFTTTPANIFTQMVKYSPVEFAKGLGDALVHGGNAQNADSMARGTTGTAIMAIGIALRALGAITGGEDDDKDKAAWDKATGNQAYSIGGRWSYDWIQPVGSMLALGAELYDVVSEGEEAGPAILDAIYTAGDSAFELSILQNLVDVVKGQGSTTENIANAAIKGLASQLVPGIVRDVAQIIDSTVRSGYTGGSAVDTALQNVKNAIPGLSKEQAASVETSGQQMKRGNGNVLLTAFDTLINPGRTNYNTANDVDELISDLYESTDRNDIFPQLSPYNVDYDGTNYKMNGEEREAFQTLQGQTYYDLAGELVNDTGFKKLSADKKADALKEINSYALEKAKEQFFKRRGIEYESDNTKRYRQADAAMEAGLSFADWYDVRSSGDKNADKAIAVNNLYGMDDNEKLNALEVFLAPDSSGKRNATVRRYEAAMAAGLYFDTWTKVVEDMEKYKPSTKAEKLLVLENVFPNNPGYGKALYEIWENPDADMYIEGASAKTKEQRHEEFLSRWDFGTGA